MAKAGTYVSSMASAAALAQSHARASAEVAAVSAAEAEAAAESASIAKAEVVVLSEAAVNAAAFANATATATVEVGEYDQNVIWQCLKMSYKNMHLKLKKALKYTLIYCCHEFQNLKFYDR